MKSFLVVNGPNLDLLGRRQPEIYGTGSLPELESGLIAFGRDLGLEITTFQSNHEGELIEVIHTAEVDGLVLNPGAFTHTSHAIADAVRASGIPTVEVHLSNIHEREPWRAVSVVAPACVRSIYGRGVAGYRAAIRHHLNRTTSPGEEVRYGPHRDNIGDLRRGERDLVVLLHGGVWKHQFERDTIESLAVDLHQRGHSSWNVEYRRIGAGGGWPGSAHDVLAALDFIPQLELPDGKVTVIGHSAGGYLGMWAAPRSKTSVDLIVGLAPIIDLELCVFDAGELEPESRLLLEAGAPPRVTPGGIPAFLIHPIEDAVVPFQHSSDLASETGVMLKEYNGGHFDLLDPSKPHWELVLERLSP